MKSTFSYNEEFLYLGELLIVLMWNAQYGVAHLIECLLNVFFKCQMEVLGTKKVCSCFTRQTFNSLRAKIIQLLQFLLLLRYQQLLYPLPLLLQLLLLLLLRLSQRYG